MLSCFCSSAIAFAFGAQCLASRTKHLSCWLTDAIPFYFPLWSSYCLCHASAGNLYHALLHVIIDFTALRCAVFSPCRPVMCKFSVGCIQSRRTGFSCCLEWFVNEIEWKRTGKTPSETFTKGIRITERTKSDSINKRLFSFDNNYIARIDARTPPIFRPRSLILSSGSRFAELADYGQKSICQTSGIHILSRTSRTQ